MKLSIAIICKNEEAVLEDCLLSVKDADNIYIVDTGSTDRTKEIAKKYTNNIYDFVWIDDFSAARNYAKSKCTGDWILSIDADHVLNTPISKVKEEIAKAKTDVLMIRSKSGKAMHYREVLFKNTPEIFWKGKVHESLNKVTYEKADIERECGYSINHSKDPDRNLRILLASEQTPRTKFYLGNEYYDRREYKLAYETYKLYLKVAYWRPEITEAHFKIAKCLFNLNRGDEARLHCLQAIMGNPQFKEAYEYMAVMSWEKDAKVWREHAKLATNENVLFIR